MIGPGASKHSSGGIVTVIDNTMQNLDKDLNVIHIVTMRPTSAMKRVWQYFLALYKILINLIKRGPKIAHIHMSSYTSFYRKSTIIMLLKLFRVPIIIHSHSGEVDIFFENLSSPMKRYVKWIFSLVDKAIFLTQGWNNWYHEKIGIDNSMVIYNGVQDYHDSNSLPLTNRENTILFLGRLTKDKGIYDLLSAFEIVLRSIPAAQLKICGDGEMDKCIETSVNLGIDKQVDFLGWVGEDEKYRLLNESKIYLLPSYFEALPMGLLEAMSAGLASVSSSIGGIPEVIENDRNGFLVEVGKIDEISDSIISLFENPEKISHIGEEARRSYLNKFNILNITHKIEDLYIELLSNKIKV